MIRDQEVLHLRVEDVREGITSRLAEIVRPPKSVRVERKGSRVTLWCKDRGKFFSAVGTSGADHYDAYWAEDVDISTQQGILNGAARATKVGDVTRVFIEEREVPIEITNPKFQNGYFYVFGSSPLGDRSIDFCFSGKQSSEILDDTLPAQVDNFTASESGETHNGTVVSAVAFQYYAPASISFAGVQFFLKNYPNVGEVTEYYVDRYFGPPKGVSNGKFLALPARRVPAAGATISATNTSVNVVGVGTKFFSMFAGGDVLEILGAQGTVQSVTDDTHLVLTAGWTGKTVTNFSDWIAIGLVTIYAVAMSKAGTHGDYTQAPFVSVLFDGVLSAPLAPTLAGTALGNANRLTVIPTPGTLVDHITLYKGRGAGLAFTDPLVKPVFTWSKDVNNLSAPLQFDDQDFSLYDREQRQIFSYYATQTNVRGAEGPASARLEIAAMLDTVSGRQPGHRHPAARNLIWNGMCWFNANATVDVTNVNQDTKMNTGGVPPAGFYRIDHEESALTTPAGFQNSTEIILPSPGAVGKYAAIKGRVDGWDNANGHIPKGAYVTFQFKQRTSGGAPNGLVRADCYQYNAADGVLAQAFVVKRLSNDSIDETSLWFDFDPATLLTTHRLFWCTFHLRTDIGCDHIRWRLLWQDGTSAANINVTELALTIGTDVPVWTGDLATNVLYAPPSGGAPIPPHMPRDNDGSGLPYLRLEQLP